MRRVERTCKELHPDLPLQAAIAKLLSEDETAQGYSARNARAIEQMTNFLQEPAIVELMEKLHRATDAKERAALQHRLEVRRHESVDIEALHRHLRANAARMTREFSLGHRKPADETGP